MKGGCSLVQDHFSVKFKLRCSIRHLELEICKTCNTHITVSDLKNLFGCLKQIRISRKRNSRLLRDSTLTLLSEWQPSPAFFLSEYRKRALRCQLIKYSDFLIEIDSNLISFIQWGVCVCNEVCVWGWGGGGRGGGWYLLFNGSVQYPSPENTSSAPGARIVKIVRFAPSEREVGVPRKTLPSRVRVAPIQEVNLGLANETFR